MRLIDGLRAGQGLPESTSTFLDASRTNDGMVLPPRKNRSQTCIFEVDVPSVYRGIRSNLRWHETGKASMA